MKSYTPVTTEFNDSIYTFEKSDYVLGGDNGTSNRPIKQLANNSAYLKKFKGRIFKGSQSPNETGFDNPLDDIITDSNTLNNTLYFQTTTGSFWIPDNQYGSSWTNISKNAIMNVKGLQINEGGNINKYFYFRYNSNKEHLELVDENGNYGDVRVGNVFYDTLDGQELDISYIADNEILLLFNIGDASENTNAQYAVKRLEDISGITITNLIVGTETGETITLDRWEIAGGDLTDYLSSNDFVQISNINEDTGEQINGYYKVNTVSTDEFTTSRLFNAADSSKSGQSGIISKDNSAMIYWNNTSSYWELKDRSGSLLPLNCSGLYIDGIPVSSVADRVINNQTTFDELFANIQETGSNTCYLRTPEDGYETDLSDEYIVIKKNDDTGDGSYTLNNSVVILGNNVTIETIDGACIIYSSSNISIKANDNTNLSINEVKRTRNIEVLSENSYYTDGPNVNEQIILNVDDNISLFSNTPGISKKHIINAIHKNVNNPNDIFSYDSGSSTINIDNDTTNNISTNVWDTVDFEYDNSHYILVVFRVPSGGGAGNDQIGYSLYKLDENTNEYDRIGGNDSALPAVAGFGEVFELAISKSSTYVHVVFSLSSANVRYGYISLANIITSQDFLPDPSTSIHGATLYNIDLYSTTNDVLYFSGTTAGNQIVFAMNDNGVGVAWDASITMNGGAQPNTNTESTYNTSIINNGTDILITYADSSQTGEISLYCLYSTDGTAFTKHELDNTDECGYFSKIILSEETGGNDFYIAYNYGTSRSIIKFAELQIVGGIPSLTGKINAINRYNNANFENLDIKLNTANKYPSETNLIQIIGFNQEDGFSLSTTDDTADVGVYTSTIINKNGNPIISYYDVDNNILKVAWYNGSTWDLSTVDDTANVGQYTSIVIDSDGNPIISYYDVTNGTLKIASYNGVTWDLSTIDDTADVGQYTSIAMDNNGNPIISYYDITNTSLKVAWYNGVTWDLSTIDSTADVGQYTSIAIDGDGYPIISYYDVDNKDLKIAWYDGSTWNLSIIDDTSANIGLYTSIAIDSDGYPIISYYDATHGDLKVAWYDGVTWNLNILDNTETGVGDSEDVGQYTSISIDNDGNPVISYYDVTNAILKTAWYDGSTWNLDVVDNTADVGQYTSIAIDDSGNSIISYYDVTNGALKIAWHLSPLYTALSTDKSTWYNKSINLIEYDNTGFIGSLFNDYLFILYYNDIVETGIFNDRNFLAKLHYNFEIFANKLVNLNNESNMILSNDFIENLNLNLYIDANYATGDELIGLHNCINSQIKINVINSNHTNAISGGDINNFSKTYNNIIIPKIYENNTCSYNINKINHSIINNCFISSGISSQNFNDCKNINILGFVDDISTIGNGDFDE